MTEHNAYLKDVTVRRRRPSLSSGLGRTRSSTEKLLATGVVALVVVALAVGLVMTNVRLHHANSTVSDLRHAQTTDVRLRQADAVDRARVSSLAAARTYAVDIASYDYRDLGQDFGKVLAHAAPAFTKSFTQSSNALKPVLAKYKATAKATVVAAGLTTCTPTQAVAVILLDQTVTNTAQKKGPTTDQSRVSMTLVEVKGHWLIQQVKLL